MKPSCYLKKYCFTLVLLVSFLGAHSQDTSQKGATASNAKMKIEIWSDVMCPFCYMGKRNFEAALEKFPHRDQVEIVWRSFQLAPGLKTQPGKNIHQFLAEHKGISLDQATKMNEQVTIAARQSGLVYNFDKSVVANSFNAHRFTHFAKEYGKQNEAEELLFRSYFTDGKNIDDYPTLLQLGSEIGLDTTALRTALENGRYAENVKADIDEGRQAGLRGVPFFLFNKKHTVSGAQESSTFLKTLEKAFNEWKKENTKTN